ncbi:MAG TPA: hypothetical protein PLE10_01625 [Brevefilum sp.]|nr:hypothetical protein [Brevefilum sp.]HPL69090.1 hypothetical protein [Brevefilum sp.]
MSVLSKLSDAEKIRFTEELLSRFLSPGFGALPKREIEILIFHLLCHKTDAFTGLSNYDISNELKISETKVKSFKIEASLKYQQMDHQEALIEIARLFFEYNELKPALEDDTVIFALEDPVLKREFEHAVKELGYFVDHSFHREIIKVKASVFLEIFIRSFEEAEKKFIQMIMDQHKDDSKFQKQLIKQHTISKQIELFFDAHTDKIGLILTLLSIISPFITP